MDNDSGWETITSFAYHLDGRAKLRRAVISADGQNRTSPASIPELLRKNPFVEAVAGVEHHEEIDGARLLDLDTHHVATKSPG